jgi:hypothetical protein
MTAVQRKRAMSADSVQTRDGVQICLSTLLFDTCGPLLAAPSGLTVAAVSRLPAHCSLRAHITSAEWATAAGTAFGLADAVGARLFDAFFLLAQQQQHRIEYARALLLTQRDGRPLEPKAAQRTVPLVGFMLFLMVQVFLEKHTAGGRNSVTGELSTDAALQFVKQHLADMVVLAGLSRHGKITQAELAELRMLFREFTTTGQEAPFGTGLGHLWPTQSSAATSAVEVNVLVMFLRARLVLPTEIRNGTAATATHRGAHAQTVTITSAPPIRPHSSVRLLRFSQSTAYVAAPLPHTVVSQCVNSLIVLGPVGGCLMLEGLEQCQVVALCAGIVVSKCRSTNIFVCTNNAPILVGDNENVKFAPYDSHYPSLEEHLQTAGVSPKLNLFNERIPATMLLPAHQFAPVSIPLPPSSVSSTTAVTRSNPCPVPQAYADAAAARANRAKAVAAQIQDAHRRLEEAGRRDLAAGLRQRVQRAFAEWLETTGQAQCIADLMGGTTTA